MSLAAYGGPTKGEQQWQATTTNKAAMEATVAMATIDHQLQAAPNYGSELKWRAHVKWNELANNIPTKMGAMVNWNGEQQQIENEQQQTQKANNTKPAMASNKKPGDGKQVWTMASSNNLIKMASNK